MGREARVSATLEAIKKSNKAAAAKTPETVVPIAPPKKPKPRPKPRTELVKEADRERYRCPGKTEARMFIYEHAREKLGADLFNASKHIVIASQECGDIDYLKGHRIPVENIIACDIDPVARIAAEVWGATISPHETIQETVPWAKEQIGEDMYASQWKIGTINVDLTHTLLLGIPILKEVLEHAPSSAIVSFTYLRSRDIFKSDSERLLHLTANIGKTVLQFPYQSRTHSSVGSPMCVAIIQS
jgi:hypothetical protein